MTRLAVIGDVHARRSRFVPVLEHIAGQHVDGILLVGDLGSALPPKRLDEGRLRRYRRVLDGLLAEVEALGLPFAWVPGNHDLPDADGPHCAERTCVDVAGLGVSGFGGAPVWRNDPHEWSEADGAAALARLPQADVYLMHCPPHGTPLDWVPVRQAHVGSHAVRDFALARSGVMVCGHIHESPGACRLGRMLCLNAGGLGRPWGRAQVGWVELDQGAARVGHTDLEQGTARWWTLRDAPAG